MILWGRAGLLLGVLAHAGAGSCAHVSSGGSPNFSGREAPAPRPAAVEVRSNAHVDHPGAEAAAAVVDAALRTVASAPDALGDAPEAAGGGDDGPEPAAVDGGSAQAR